MQLQALLNDCQSVDCGNRIVARLQRIEKDAAKLTRTDFSALRKSFMQFLIDEATKEDKAT